ncbi:hypothetical protein [Catenulispora sp. GP43]|uniref:hypothetical protein n=1 Tax=Catenulispora sp. GP43 TaxID=3156263 RepID=UPI003514DF6A
MPIPGRDRLWELAILWADHQVRACDVADYVLATAAPGSPSESALRLLAQATGDYVRILQPV